MRTIQAVINNGNYETIEVVDGTLQQGAQITVQREGRPGERAVLHVNSLVTDDQPDLAICTLLNTYREPEAPPVEPPAVLHPEPEAAKI